MSYTITILMMKCLTIRYLNKESIVGKHERVREVRGQMQLRQDRKCL